MLKIVNRERKKLNDSFNLHLFIYFNVYNYVIII